LTFVGTAAMVLVPIYLFIRFTYLKGLDTKAMDQSFMDVVSPLRHFGPLYIPDPFPWFFRSFWRPIPALFVLFYFARRFRRDPRAGALGLFLAVPVLIGFNPLVFPVVAKITGLQVATRILNLTNYPSLFLLAWAVTEIVRGRELEPDGAGSAGAVGSG